MTFIGPSRFGRDRICGSGQTCVVDGIGAFGVSDGDKFFMLDTRSEAVVRSRSVHYEGLMVSILSGNFGESILAAFGGRYRRCWCARRYKCDLASDFWVDIRRMAIIGRSGSITGPDMRWWSGMRFLSWNSRTSFARRRPSVSAGYVRAEQ